MRFNKAQIRMMESIAVLVVFFFLLIFGYSFYARVQEHQIKQQQKESMDIKAIRVAQKASFLPDLQCSIKNVREDNCFDILKMAAFTSSTLNDAKSGIYFDMFGYSNISVNRIFPSTNDWLMDSGIDYPVTIYEKEYDDGALHDKITTNMPITLYDPTTKKYSFGVLKVEVYT